MQFTLQLYLCCVLSKDKPSKMENTSECLHKVFTVVKRRNCEDFAIMLEFT